MRIRRIGKWAPGLPIALLAGTALLVAACTTGAAGSTDSGSGASQPNDPAAATPAPTYAPRTDVFIVTTVPLLVHEQQDTLDYLKKDFAAGGLLDGKEVYGFYPSTLTVYQGDTVKITWVNPADDPHTIVIPGTGVSATVNGESKVDSTFVASAPGIFYMGCTVDEHSPYMWGQLVVLPASDAPLH